MATPLEKVKRLEQYLMLDPVAVDPILDLTLNKLLTREFNRLAELKARLVRELQTFETQYHLKSKEFYAQYERGELGDEMDFIEWAATIEMMTHIEKRLLLLQVESA